MFQVITEKTLCSKDFTSETFLWEKNCKYDFFKFSYTFSFLPAFYFRKNQKPESNFQQVGSLVIKKHFCIFLHIVFIQICFHWVTFHFKGMSNSINVYKGTFLHVIPVCIYSFMVNVNQINFRFFRFRFVCRRVQLIKSQKKNTRNRNNDPEICLIWQVLFFYFFFFFFFLLFVFFLSFCVWLSIFISLFYICFNNNVFIILTNKLLYNDELMFSLFDIVTFYEKVSSKRWFQKIMAAKPDKGLT